MDMVIHPFEVYYINLNPTIGAEIKKTRPCVVISPIVMNSYLATVIVAPLTSTIRSYPCRVNCVFDKKKGQIALDQLRTVDKTRLIKKTGTISHSKTQAELCAVLQEMFALKGK